MIRPIQYLRAIAALMVVWHHGLRQIPAVMHFIKLPEFGASGVDIFFVISGFIMLATTADKPLTAGQFFRLRIIRVVPLYWLMTLLMIGCAVIAPTVFRSLQYSPAAVVKSLLFIPYNSLSFPGKVWPVLVPGWTLNFEMFFYALFAISLYLPRWRLQAMMGTLCLLTLCGYVFGHSGPLSTVYSSPMLLEFGAGMWLANDWASGQCRRRHVIESFGFISIGFILLTMRASPISLLVGATMVVAGALNPKLNELKSRVLYALGNASYSIYLTHLFALGALRIIWADGVPASTFASSMTFMAIAITLCAVVGYIVYLLVERPLTRWLRDKVRRGTDAPGSAK